MNGYTQSGFCKYTVCRVYKTHVIWYYFLNLLKIFGELYDTVLILLPLRFSNLVPNMYPQLPLKFMTFLLSLLFFYTHTHIKSTESISCLYASMFRTDHLGLENLLGAWPRIKLIQLISVSLAPLGICISSFRLVFIFNIALKTHVCSFSPQLMALLRVRC